MIGSHCEKSDSIGASLSLKKSEKNPNFDGLPNDVDAAVSVKLLTAPSCSMGFLFFLY